MLSKAPNPRALTIREVYDPTEGRPPSLVRYAV
jgi:hypothetical protein